MLTFLFAMRMVELRGEAVKLAAETQGYCATIVNTDDRKCHNRAAMAPNSSSRIFP
jgi:hypothetical protein